MPTNPHLALRRILPLGVLLVPFLAPAALADGPKLRPGKWETTVVTTISIMPQPRTTTRTESLPAPAGAVAAI